MRAIERWADVSQGPVRVMNRIDCKVGSMIEVSRSRSTFLHVSTETLALVSRCIRNRSFQRSPHIQHVHCSKFSFAVGDAEQLEWDVTPDLLGIALLLIWCFKRRKWIRSDFACRVVHSKQSEKRALSPESVSHWERREFLTACEDSEGVGLRTSCKALRSTTVNPNSGFSKSQRMVCTASGKARTFGWV